MSATDPFSPSSRFRFLSRCVPSQRRALRRPATATRSSKKLPRVTGALEAAYTSASKGAGDFTAKIIDIAKLNTGSAFDFAQSLMGVKSLPEAFELKNAHARKQYEVVTAQAKDLAEFTQKVATETVEPIKANAAKTFKISA